VHKSTIAVAEDGLRGEVRHNGVVENRADVVIKLAGRLGRRGERLHFCYEAGPCGYGLHRLLSGLGHDCTVVAPSLIPQKPGDQPARCGDAGQAAQSRRTDGSLGS
jgi:transposase